VRIVYFGARQLRGEFECCGRHALGDLIVAMGGGIQSFCGRQQSLE
jgi:hypothetical protein